MEQRKILHNVIQVVRASEEREDMWGSFLFKKILSKRGNGREKVKKIKKMYFF
jgi:hypothetical protein